MSEGICAYAAVLNEANSTIILTDEGVVLVDTGQSPKDSHIVMAAVKKLTQQPVRFIIHTEPHPDPCNGRFRILASGYRDRSCWLGCFDESLRVVYSGSYREANGRVTGNA